MAISIIKLGDFKTENVCIKTLVFGPSGVGKTRLISTIPSEHLPKSLLSDPDKGVLAILGRCDELRYVRVENHEDFEELWDFVLKKQDDLKWFILDNLTEMYYNLIKKYADEFGVPEKGAWQKIQGIMHRRIRQVRDLRCNVLITCLDLRDKDKENGTIKIKPSFSGKFSDHIVSFFDQVMYLMIRPETPENPNPNGERVLLTRKTPLIDCKDRLDALSPIEKPDMTVIYNKSVEKLKSLRKQS